MYLCIYIYIYIHSIYIYIYIYIYIASGQDPGQLVLRNRTLEGRSREPPASFCVLRR